MKRQFFSGDGTMGRDIKAKLKNMLPEEQIERIQNYLDARYPEGGYDEFGMDPDALMSALPFALFMYKHYFRVILNGIENIPAEGPALIIGNHSGQIPMDGMMVTTACMTQSEHPRMPRAMIEKWFPTLPFVGSFFNKMGQMVGVTENAERLLRNGELMMIFPEGALGSGKTWDIRYKLQRFTHGFMELSIKHKAPIIPISVIGGEEQAPSFVNVKPLADAIGMPYFPITPTFPWTGLFGFIPYPSRYRITIGEPMDFSMYQDDLDNPERVHEHVETVRSHIQEMVNRGLEERPFPGF